MRSTFFVVRTVAAGLLGTTADKVVFANGFVFASDRDGGTAASGFRQAAAAEPNAPRGRVPPQGSPFAKVVAKAYTERVSLSATG